MAMTVEQQEKFELLVRQLEKYARSHPAQYRIKVGLLAVFGYFYVVSIFLLLLGIIWGLRQLLVTSSSPDLNNAFNSMAFLISLGIVRLFWNYTRAPKGLTLNRKQAPELYRIIDRLTAKLQAPKCDRIFITEELNAGVWQRPRLGFLGWYQNYLFLGLPLMQALSPGQFQAVLAHELGHLSGNHSRFANWIYRLRKIWFELTEQFQERENGGFALFQWFFNWYSPYFSAYSFVLARANEYEADRCGVEMAGVQNEADADINLAVYSHFLYKSFFPSIYQQADRQPNPPSDTITQLIQQLKIGITPKDANKWLERALLQTTDYEDTHPCLVDRLTAIGYDLSKVKPPQPEVKTAAEHYLGELLWICAESLDRQWKDTTRASWQRFYQKAQYKRHNLATLNEKANRLMPLTVEEMWKRACLTENLHEPQKAIPLFQQVLVSSPDHSLSNYQLGKILLDKNDTAGIDYLQKALVSDPELAISCCDLLSDFYQTQGNKEWAQFYQKKSQAHYEDWKRSQKERDRFNFNLNLLPHQLPQEEVRQLSEQLASFPEIKKAYLVRQKMKCFPEKPFYILGITPQTLKGARSERKNYEEIIQQIETELNFSGSFRVTILQGTNLKLAQAIRKVTGACLCY
jgi:Zn-dependent protease with chaperone function